VTWASCLVASGIVIASAYALLSSDAYRDLPHSTVVAAQAQDICSVLVALLLAITVRRRSARADALRLGLFAYVAYSYAVYLIGVPMNRVFLVYVVLVLVAGAALVDGILRLEPAAWPRSARGWRERVTGWFLVVVAAMFAALWLSTLLPYALGGPPASPQGPGGVAYPVFVLDLTVALPAVGCVGVLLLRRRPMGSPLAVVALAKIVTLFTSLWIGVLVAITRGTAVHLGADAGPSLVMLVACCWLLRVWLVGPRRVAHRVHRA
jgi:hypothetical protein